MNPEIKAYNSSLEPTDKAICELLAREIIKQMPKAEHKIWHAHPVWFLDGNPIVGYSKLKNCVRLLFWSGQSFGEDSLQAEGKFKAAEARFSSKAQVDVKALKRWLTLAKEIQWDYKNIVKRKGKLERLVVPQKESSSEAPSKAEKTKHRIYTMSVAGVYPHYIAKAEKKGRTKAEVDEVIRWLTGYTQKQFEAALKNKTDFETFFAKAPRMNPDRALVKGVICGVRVEDIQEPTMREIRYLDKLIDELAKGKALEKILRKPAST
ncbi:MAG: DUF2200 family protein [Planctomycetales bacterium]|nr:DUF2200 family protein [Planctomycetales bacterium]